MNILIVTYLFYPEPIVMSTITKDLAQKMSEEHNVTVLTSRPCRPYGYKLPSALEETTWKFKRIIVDSYTHPQSDIIGRLKENISFGKVVSRYIEENHKTIDVIYINAFPLFAQKRIIKCAERFKIPTVNHVEDIYPEPFRDKVPYIGGLLYYILFPIDKWCMKHATFSVVIGEKIKEFFIKTRKAIPNKVKVVYNWQDESRFMKSIEPVNNDLFTFMYVGSISKAANLYKILEAFGRCGLKNARLLFAGSGTEKETLQALAKNEFADVNIDFIDAPGDQIAQIQNKADVLILPLKPKVSLRAVPSKLPAYLFSKKPVLACVEAESDVADIIQKAQCGWIARPDNIKDIQIAMKQAVSVNKVELSKMGDNGYCFAKEKLTANVNLLLLEEIILEASRK